MTEGAPEQKRLTRAELVQRIRHIAIIGAGAWAAGALKAAFEVNWHGVKTPEEKIDTFRNGKNGFDASNKFHAAANQPVHGKEGYTRTEYVQHVFIDTEPENMPVSVRNKLAVVAPGIPGQESRYNNNLTSRSGARFIWQFTSPMVDDLNRISGTHIPFEQAASLSTATPLAFKYFDKVIYPKVAEPALAVLKKFGLAGSPEAVEEFTTLCMVNAYNAGPTRMEHMLTTFSEKYSPSDVHQTYAYTPLSLFQSFVETALRPPGALDKRYRTEAGEYVFRVLAASESINARSVSTSQKTVGEMLTYKQDMAGGVVSAVRHTIDTATEEVVTPAFIGITGAVAGNIVEARLAHVPITLPKVTPLSRRELIRLGAGATLAAGAGVIAHHAYHTFQDGAPGLKFPDVRKLLWWGQKKTNEEKIEDAEEDIPVEYPDGTIYLPKATREKFASFGGIRKLFTRAPASYDMHVLPRSNLTSSGVVGAITRLEARGILHRVSTDDIKNNTSTYQALNYEVTPAGSSWRCRGVGTGSKQTAENDPHYLRLRRHTGEVLEEVTAEFQRSLASAGLSPAWHIRPIVNGLLRSDGKGGTNKVRGASDHSPHMFGVGMDLSLSKFDIINTTTNEFFMTGTSDNANDGALVAELKGILARVLKKMHDNKSLVLTYEPQTDHFHISAVTPERRDSVKPKQPTPAKKKVGLAKKTPESKPKPKPKKGAEKRPAPKKPTKKTRK